MSKASSSQATSKSGALLSKSKSSEEKSAESSPKLEHTNFATTRATFNLTKVPVRPRLTASRIVQRCDKENGNCSCPTCNAARTEVVEDESTVSPKSTDQSVDEQTSRDQNAKSIEGAATSAESTPATNETETAGFIADDSTSELSEGQLKKTEFLQRLREEICSAVGPVIAVVGQTTEGCPYLNHWLDHYQTKDATEVEKTVRRYAADSANAKSASDYISIVTQRAVRAASIWALTGRVIGIPDGVSASLPGRTSEQEPATVGVQAKAKAGGVKNENDLHAIKEQLGEGQPLASGVKSKMESAFGMSFSNVRTHTDSNAATISNQVNARAFTVGNHVAFGTDEYKPGTLIGDALIAHELAHTVQQRGAETPMNKSKEGTEGYDALENDADLAAESVVRSLWSDPSKEESAGALHSSTRLKSGLQLQRCSSTPAQATTPVQAGPRQAAPVAGGACDRNPKAPNYTPTEGGVTPTLQDGDFGTTSKLAALFTYGACRDSGTWRFYLATLTVNIKSAVRPIDYRININAANDPAVTASTYRAIIADLDPHRSGTFHPSCGGNRFDDPVTTYSRRREYWKQQFVIDHEAFHRTDWNDMYRPNLVAAETQVLAHAIPESQASSAADAISQTRSTLDQFMIAAYQQTCQQYSPHQESRAYDNGAPQYQGLVDQIRSRATTEGWP